MQHSNPITFARRHFTAFSRLCRYGLAISVALGVTSARAYASVPTTPTMTESGLPGFEAGGWFGVFAPSRTSPAIVSLLNYEINRALAEEALQKTFVSRGLTTAPGTPAEFRALIERDSERWGRIVRAAVLKS